MPKGRREEFRVGFGEYQTAAFNDAARAYFLHTIVEHAAYVFDDLIAVEAQIPCEDLADGVWSRSPLIAAAEGPLPPFLHNWAVRWHLYVPWVVETARTTLKIRAENPKLRQFRGWPALMLGARWEPAFVYAPIVWNPMKEREAAFRARVDRYIAEIRRDVEACGGVTHSPEKRNPEHFVWLLRYQVDAWSVDDIIERCLPESTEESTVRKAVEGTAALIGLPLRK